MFMYKRGQIYILAVILLAVVIYGLSTVLNIVEQEEVRGDFETLAQNYEIESSKLINSVLQSGGPVPEAFENFTILFTSYSKAKSPGFNIFYALAYKNKMYFGNFMDEEMLIYVPCPGVGSDCPTGGEGYKELLGCLDDVSAQMSFEGMTINATYLRRDLDLTKEDCFWSTDIGAAEQYCVGIGGVMYQLPVERDIPRIFSLSRLESGGQVLNSLQGDVGQEQACEGRDEDECRSCGMVCCWDEEEGENGECKETKCPCGEKNDYCDDFVECCDGFYCEGDKCKEKGIECGDGQCKGDETCESCPADCGECPSVCDDGKCKGDETCASCPADCLDDGEVCCDTVAYTGDCCEDDDCIAGTCVSHVCAPLECAEKGESCEEVACCSGHYCDTDKICKEIVTGITTCEELQIMKYYLDGDYHLLNDIDCSETSGWNDGAGFEPIGASENPFTGSFDGKIYKITELYIDTTGQYVGLFGFTGSSADIRNVSLENSDISGGYYTGGLVGKNQGSITHSYLTGSVNAMMYVGGLTGINDGSITSSYSDASIGSNFNFAGGLVGSNIASGSITNSYSTGNVNGETNVGGLVGLNAGSITDSYSTGNVTGNTLVGGLIGRNNGGTTSNSYWDKETSEQSTSDGGIGKTTAQMKQQSTFVDWDFTNVWGICQGYSYPWLKWRYNGCEFKCQRSAYIDIEDKYECDDPNEEDWHCIWLDIGIYRYGPEAYGDIIDYGKCIILCYYPEWTACSGNPTCGSDPVIGGRVC